LSAALSINIWPVEFLKYLFYLLSTNSE